METTCKRKGCGSSVCMMAPLRFAEGHRVIQREFAFNGPSRKDHECTNVVGGCGCSHSEPRAVMQVLHEIQEHSIVQTLVLFCSYSPCTNCANIILDSGVINGVVYGTFTEHDARGHAFLAAEMPVISREEIEGAIRPPLAPAIQTKSDVREKVYAAIQRWHKDR